MQDSKPEIDLDLDFPVKRVEEDELDFSKLLDAADSVDSIDRPPADPDFPFVGTRVGGGRYLVTAPLANGGMSKLYEGVDTQDDRRVVLKFSNMPRPTGSVRSALQEQQRLLDRCAIEAKTAKDLGGARIIRIYDLVCDVDGLLVLVMEHLEGADLAEHLRLREPIPPSTALILAEQILTGLSQLHAAGVIHRDLKPSNVFCLLDTGDAPINAKIVDLGVVKNLSVGHQTTTGTFVGTYRYAAPEQFRGAPPDPANDIYAFGLVMRTALTGQDDYANCETAADYRLAHDVALPSIRGRVEGLTPEFARLLDQCVRLDPDERPPASALLEAIQRLRLSNPVRSAPPVSSPPTRSLRPASEPPSLSMPLSPKAGPGPVPPTHERAAHDLAAPQPRSVASSQGGPPARAPVVVAQTGVVKLLIVVCFLMFATIIWLIYDRGREPAPAPAPVAERPAAPPTYEPKRAHTPEAIQARIERAQPVPRVIVRAADAGAAAPEQASPEPAPEVDEPATEAPAPKAAEPKTARLKAAKPKKAKTRRSGPKRRGSPIANYVAKREAAPAPAPAEPPIKDHGLYGTGGFVDSRPRYGTRLSPGMQFEAVLSVGVSTAKSRPVIARVAKEMKRSGEVILPKGLVLRGKASDDGRRIHIDFTQLGGKDRKEVRFAGYAIQGGNPGLAAKRVEVDDDTRASAAVGRGAIRTAGTVAGHLGGGLAGDLAGNVGKEGLDEARRDVQPDRSYYLTAPQGTAFQIVVTEGGR